VAAKKRKKAAKKAPAKKRAPARKAAPRKRGRPTIYTPALAEQICREIASGKSLREVCAPERMPDESTVRAWAVDNHEGFYPQYARACEIRAQRWAEDIVEIADDSTNDYVERLKSDGGKEVVFDGEHVQRSRTRIEARKWMVARMLPKVFGNKVAIGGDPDAPPIELTDAERATKLQALLSRVASRMGIEDGDGE
jgi:hypothetical protein